MADHLDEIARLIASEMPRRQVLRLTLVGLAATLWPGGRAEAARRRCANPCPGNLLCCGPADFQGNERCCPPGCCIRKGLFLKCRPKARFRMGGVGLQGDDAPQIQIIVSDPEGEGLGGIRLLEAVNADVVIPEIPPGTATVVVTATKVDPEQRSRVLLAAATDCCFECVAVGDPVLTELRIGEGSNRVRETFSDIPAAERYVTLQNGSPGLRRVQLVVNGKRLTPRWLRDGGVRRIDIGSAMLAEKNIVTVIANGRPGTSALLVIADAPPETGTGTLDATSVPSLIDWRPGSSRPGIDSTWGR